MQPNQGFQEHKGYCGTQRRVDGCSNDLAFAPYDVTKLENKKWY